MSHVWFVLEMLKHDMDKVVETIKKQLPDGCGSRMVSVKEQDEMEAIAKDVDAIVLVIATSINKRFGIPSFGGKISKTTEDYVRALDDAIKREEAAARRAARAGEKEDAGWRGVIGMACVHVEGARADVVHSTWELGRTLHVKDRILDSYLDLELDDTLRSIKPTGLERAAGFFQALDSFKKHLDNGNGENVDDPALHKP